MSQNDFIELIPTCHIIEGWILSAITFNQLLLLNDVVSVFISQQRFPEENPIVLEGLRSVLGDKIVYQKEKIAIEYENRSSSL